MAAQKKPVNKTIRVEVKRAFTWDENVLKVGSVLDLPETFALTAIACNKASRISPEMDVKKLPDPASAPAPVKAPAPVVKPGGK